MRPIRAILSDGESDSIFLKKQKFLTWVSRGGYHRWVVSVTEAFSKLLWELLAHPGSRVESNRQLGNSSPVAPMLGCSLVTPQTYTHTHTHTHTYISLISNNYFNKLEMPTGS